MNGSAPRPAQSLTDYELEVTLTSNIPLTRQRPDSERDCVKRIDISLLKIDRSTGEAMKAGSADGLVAMGSLAVQDGSSLLKVCEAASADLSTVYWEISGMTEGVKQTDDILYIDDVTIARGHDIPGLRKELFDQVVRTLGIPVQFAGTWCENFSLTRRIEQPHNWSDHLPLKTLFLNDSGVVIWDRTQQQDHLAWLDVTDDEDEEL